MLFTVPDKMFEDNIIQSTSYKWKIPSTRKRIISLMPSYLICCFGSFLPYPYLLDHD
jgi:hypothetical protein